MESFQCFCYHFLVFSPASDSLAYLLHSLQRAANPASDSSAYLLHSLHRAANPESDSSAYLLHSLHRAANPAFDSSAYLLHSLQRAAKTPSNSSAYLLHSLQSAATKPQLWEAGCLHAEERELATSAFTLWSELIMSLSSSSSHFSTCPRALEVEMTSRSWTSSPSLLFMCVMSSTSVNSSLAMPSKHFFRWGCTLVGRK